MEDDFSPCGNLPASDDGDCEPIGIPEASDSTQESENPATPEMDFSDVAQAMLGELVASIRQAGEDGGESLEAEIDADDASSSTVMMSVKGYTFDTIVGYEDEIARLREMGVVADPDPEFAEFVEQMRRQHGLYEEPLGTALLFKGQAREDADRLMLATANELGKPVMVMRVMEGAPGSQALCIMAAPGMAQAGFTGSGTLVLVGVDEWGNPEFDPLQVPEGFEQGPGAGALRAINLICMAVANPRISVFASSGPDPAPDSFVMRLLGPLDEFEVPVPGDDERDAIWDHLMEKHVSMSALDRFELVELSRGLPRCDIFGAALEAVAQAFHQSLAERRYVPVSRGNLLDKIAAYQPLDSREYELIEQCAIQDLMADIERYERDEM